MTEPGLDIVAIFQAHGHDRYREPVTQQQHALQCAALARRGRADDDLVLAALLHDVGHCGASPSADSDAADETGDRHHGHRAAALLRPHVPGRLAWLVECHVVAKRYLCTIDPHYAAALSAASRRSLRVQGGSLRPDRCAALERHPWFADALALRRWDDLAKDPAAVVPGLDAYRPLLTRYFGPQSVVGVTCGPDRPHALEVP
jgi:gamma-butyrobetaine dioxygenase